MDLVADGLRKSYRGRRVVDGVSLSISPGEIVGLLGPNGAGKTTCFYMMVGLVEPDGGRVMLGERDITDWPMFRRARAGVAYLAQEPSAFRRLDVQDNIWMVLEALGTDASEAQRRIDNLLEDFGLSALRHQRAETLSGGERRRLEVARSLAIEPTFILLDEPFAGIDPLAVIDLQRIIGHLKSLGIGILITDHNVRETLKITDRAYIIKDGKIFATGDPVGLSDNEDVRRIYLGEEFRL
ncbi:MAG TPA: LPS export ABC transporter ATP-binding protein [Thermoanaerobaculales bacterium]|nr:LPS export ABC transporter ATP-binding protein [Thermoanaerobaculales bacterium]HPA81598.1 LPS export ABC transporter ATP-binding protein [Thermoanaerobaculales bacterium]HQL31128.1 LPS export ABC transporter ATP-binding protein [Thermoanaerobaculales bacterium]HQN97499.1 LPS export ABC transporter ATP-binding protein [Thermoanaerobaculales bacterium]